MSARTAILSRPAGPAPRGTSAGIVGYTLLSTAAPFIVLAGLAILVCLVPVLHPDLRFASVVNLVFWVLLAPFAWLLLRMLRLRYWQPWTGPEDWESGNEAPPRLGMTPDRLKP